MHSRVVATLVLLTIGFFSQANGAAISARQDGPVTVEDALNAGVTGGDFIDELALTALENISELASTEETQGEVQARTIGGSRCNLFNTTIRREWGSLSTSERKAYIDAVLCLQAKPSKSDPVKVPGARSRYDDFVAVHVNQTLSIHGTANFLSWHRYYTWSYEQALRNECGYKGAQPYWNWAKSASNPEASPVFDGSATSMSGNGEYIAGRNDTLVGGGAIKLPPGNGGGCVKSGPFKDMVVNLGPVIASTLPGVNKNPLANGLGYNPRCLRRDISNYSSSRWSRTIDIAELILSNPTISKFQTRMQGDFANGFLGVHSAGHFTIAGDPGGDLYVSPGDPAFFLHHAQIDRVWWIWQNLDIRNRINVIGDTITINNKPPSRDGSLDDTINLGVIAPTDVKLRTLMNTMDGPFCYIYL
ncbi:hypothetical protein DFH27DRAFT_364301 [Peziza echinospora]|nr:hypothetical protein DFH27DRAFT_364301 [Peziza echinospora]